MNSYSCYNDDKRKENTLFNTFQVNNKNNTINTIFETKINPNCDINSIRSVSNTNNNLFNMTNNGNSLFKKDPSLDLFGDKVLTNTSNTNLTIFLGVASFKVE